MFVVGWCRHQSDWLKVETLEEHIRDNLEAFSANAEGMVALGIFDTHDQASEFCLKVQAIRNARLDNE